MNEKIIHVHIWDPSCKSIFHKPKQTDRGELHIYKCKNTEGCDAFKKGQCINAGNVFGEWCPNGSRSNLKSCTMRAKAYRSQIDEWKERYKNELNALKSAPKKITKVHGGWMMPYAHMSNNEKVPFKSKGGFMASGCTFMEDNHMNKENMLSILDFRPQALMGGEIKSYQKESVPKFVFDFNAEYPEIFAELLGDSDKAKEILSSMNFVGRKAYLKTIAHGEVVISKRKWLWDGEKLSITDSDFMIFEPVKWDSCFASFTPKDDSTIEITDNCQVTSETKFAD